MCKVSSISSISIHPFRSRCSCAYEKYGQTDKQGDSYTVYTPWNLCLQEV